MILKRIFLLFFASLLACSPIKDIGYKNVSRVDLETDTLVSFHVMVDQSKVKTKPMAYYHWYKKDTINVNQGSYSGRLLHDGFQSYDAAGNMILAGSFNEGKRTGFWKSWYPDGQLASTVKYKNGAKQGKEKCFDIQGRLKTVTTYRRGQKHGVFKLVEADTVIVKRYVKGVEKNNDNHEESPFSKLKKVFKKKEKKTKDDDKS